MRRVRDLKKYKSILLRIQILRPFFGVHNDYSVLIPLGRHKGRLNKHPAQNSGAQIALLGSLSVKVGKLDNISNIFG